MKIGILPAGGKSVRWGGYPKEMLPLGRTWSLLDRHILLQTRALADYVVIMSSEEKRALHEWYVHEHKKWPDVGVSVADSVMAAIKGAIGDGQDNDFIFGMPDTYTDIPLYPETLESPLMLGLFETESPKRFGVLRNGQIVDKDATDIVKPRQAWGAFMFNAEVAEYWMSREFEDHTDMLNAVLRNFEWGSWEIKAYWDVAMFEDYLQLLGGLYNAEE